MCNLASYISVACESIGELKAFLKDDKSDHGKILDHHAPLRYHALPRAGENRRPQLIAFCDDGYASLRASCSVESCLILYGVPIRRNGPIERMGNVVTFYTREISRVCRSSARGEGISLANAADLTLYTQCVMSAILFRQHDFAFLQQSEEFPLIYPFKPPPEAGDIKPEMSSLDNRCRSAGNNSSVLYLGSAMSVSHVQSRCLKCRIVRCAPMNYCVYFNLSTDVIANDASALGPELRALILSDCSNTVSAAHQGNPGTDEKCYRIICCYLEGFLRFLSFDYCNAAFNLSDTGTKRLSTVQLWRNFVRTGCFKIGFSVERHVSLPLQTVSVFLKNECDLAMSRAKKAEGSV